MLAYLAIELILMKALALSLYTVAWRSKKVFVLLFSSFQMMGCKLTPVQYLPIT